MARLSKRTKPEPPPKDDANVGRDLLDFCRKQNEEHADTLREGEAVQYFDEGWRYGHIEKLPDADEPRYGEARIVHPSTGRVWVPAGDVKAMNQEWESYFKWKRGDNQ